MYSLRQTVFIGILVLVTLCVVLGVIYTIEKSQRDRAKKFAATHIEHVTYLCAPKDYRARALCNCRAKDWRERARCP